MLAKAIAQQTNLSAKDVQKVLRAMCFVLVQELRENGKSSLCKLVRFSTKIQPARKEKRKNMFGELRVIPARREWVQICAKVGKTLRDAMR